MLIENSFDVDADPDRVFRFLQNPHNVATCFPGAELTEDLGDDQYRGKVKIKLGPVTAAFSGIARITEKDDVARIAVLVAEGKDARGSGTAKATATMRVEPTESGSNVLLKTDLTISGKLAQFGRGIMADVSGRMVNDLAVRVRERIESEPEAIEATAAEPAAEAAEAKPAEAAPESRPEAVTEAPAETAAASDVKPETPAAADSKSTTVAEAPAETTTASGSTSEAAAGVDTGVVSGATTETATAAATAKPAAKPAAKAAPAASSEPAGAIKATTLLKVMVAGMFRRLFARLRGRSHSA